MSGFRAGDFASLSQIFEINSNNSKMSQMSIINAIFSVNWRPVTTAEEDLFHKRREHAAKTRRKFWNWRYNPKTEGYFSEAWSDRRVTQQDWSNSQWFRMTSNQYWNSSYWLMVRWSTDFYRRLRFIYQPVKIWSRELSTKTGSRTGFLA